METQGIGPPKALSVLNNEQVESRDRAILEAEKAVAALRRPEAASALAAHIQRCYQEAHEARERSGVTERLLDAQRRRRGVYSATVLAKIKEVGGSELYTHDTEIKCNTAEAIITEMMLPHRERIWSLNPTPIPELPDGIVDGVVNMTMQSVEAQMMGGGEMPPVDQIEEFARNLRTEIEDAVQREARDRAERMSLKIEDQLEDMKFTKAFNDMRSQLVTFGTGFLKGPFVCSNRGMAWRRGEYVIGESYGLACTAPSPFDMFPCPDSREVDDGYIIERILSSGKDLSLKKGVPYWQTEQIEKLLTEHPNGLRNATLTHDQPRAVHEEQGDPSQNLGKKYELLETWDDFAGAMLDEWGVKGLVASDFYSCQVVTCGAYVLKVMPNPDPLGRRPYYKTAYKGIVGSFWGNGLPHLVSDAQDMANAAIRNIANNMGFCSGPMVAIDCSRLPTGTDIEQIHPWQLFQFENQVGATTKPIEFFSVPSVVRDLMMVYDKALSRMDDESGLPAYQYGSDQAAGAARTASGLSMLMNASGRVIKEVVAMMDVNAIEPFIRRMYEWNMLYSDDDSIKGDAKVVTRGASGAILQDMKLERLSQFMQETANPFDMQILGLPGRAELLRQRAKMLDIGDSAEKAVPSGRELDARMAEATAGAAVAGETGGRNTAGTPASTMNPRGEGG